MKRNKKVMVMVMVFALALSGIAYAAWTDTLYINGTVATGNLDAMFIPATNPTDNDPSGCDVGTVAAEIGDLTGDTDGDSGTADKLTVTLDNAYPGYIATIPYTIQNTGSIPVKLSEITLSGVDAGALSVTGQDLTHPQTIAKNGTVSGSLVVEVLDGADESMTGANSYKFDVQYDITQ